MSQIKIIKPQTRLGRVYVVVCLYWRYLLLISCLDVTKSNIIRSGFWLPSTILFFCWLMDLPYIVLLGDGSRCAASNVACATVFYLFALTLLKVTSWGAAVTWLSVHLSASRPDLFRFMIECSFERFAPWPTSPLAIWWPFERFAPWLISLHDWVIVWALRAVNHFAFWLSDCFVFIFKSSFQIS